MKDHTQHTMKYSQQERYNFVMNLSPDFDTAYQIYNDMKEETLDALQTIYYELESKREIQKFSTFLYERGLFKAYDSWRTSAVKGIFRSDTRYIQHKPFLKKMEIVKLYEEYKEVL